LERIDDPEVYNFISWCLEHSNKRPTARDLLECDFLKDLDSEQTNNPVKLKSKPKEKNRILNSDAKTQDIVYNPRHATAMKRDTESPTVTMIHQTPEDQQVIDELKKSQNKKGKRDPIHKKEIQMRSKLKNELNDKESLDLFEKIEAEKNQRLNIDEDLLLQEQKFIDEYAKSKDKFDTQRKRVIENSLNKSQDHIKHEAIENPITTQQEIKNINRNNASYDKHEQEVVESRRQSEPMMKDGSKNLEQHHTEEDKSTRKGITLKLTGIKPDGTQLTIKL